MPGGMPGMDPEMNGILKMPCNELTEQCEDVHTYKDCDGVEDMVSNCTIQNYPGSI